MADLDPDLALAAVRTMPEIRSASLARDRFLMILLLSFAAIGLVLSLVGVYGVGSEMARRRTREIGIRLAIGARPAQVRWLVVRHGLALSLVGAAAGIALALAGTRVMATLLYEVAPSDPTTFVMVTGLIVFTAAVASWIPGQRASETPPAEVLRGE